MKRLQFAGSIILTLCLVLCAGADKPKPRGNQNNPGLDSPGGQHDGEIDQLEVEITFYGELGETVTDETGTYYHIWGQVFHEDKIYPPEYWGVYPLYFFGTETGVKIATTNLGPRKKVKLRLRTEVYCLRTDGSNGAAIADETETDIEVQKGETKTVDASFVSQPVPDAEGGLDRFLVKVLHPNEGGGPGNDDPALIMIKEGIFCPPENEGEILEILDQILNQ